LSKIGISDFYLHSLHHMCSEIIWAYFWSDLIFDDASDMISIVVQDKLTETHVSCIWDIHVCLLREIHFRPYHRCCFPLKPSKSKSSTVSLISRQFMIEKQKLMIAPLFFFSFFFLAPLLKPSWGKAAKNWPKLNIWKMFKHSIFKSSRNHQEWLVDHFAVSLKMKQSFFKCLIAMISPFTASTLLVSCPQPCCARRPWSPWRWWQTYADKPKTLRALKVVARATSSGVLFK